jgi:hypothetical protein
VIAIVGRNIDSLETMDYSATTPYGEEKKTCRKNLDTPKTLTITR